MTTGGGVVTSLLVLAGCCCFCFFFLPKNKRAALKSQFSTRNLGLNNATEREYHEAVAFQNKNVPEASPPDFYTGDPRMIIDASALSENKKKSP